MQETKGENGIETSILTDRPPKRWGRKRKGKSAKPLKRSLYGGPLENKRRKKTFTKIKPGVEQGKGLKKGSKSWRAFRANCFPYTLMTGGDQGGRNLEVLKETMGCRQKITIEVGINLATDLEKVQKSFACSGRSPRET